MGVETENRASDSEDEFKSDTTNTVSRPTTIPTIVQTDDSKRSEVTYQFYFHLSNFPHTISR